LDKLGDLFGVGAFTGAFSISAPRSNMSLPKRVLAIAVARSLFSTALLTLSGCVVYQPKPVDMAQLQRSYQDRTLAAPCIAAIHASGAWRAEDIIAASHCQNPELARARAVIELAQRSGELAKRYPGLALVLSAEYAKNAPESSPWTRGLSVDLPLDVGARKSLRTQAAALGTRMAEIELANVEAALHLAWFDAFDQLLFAEQEQRLLIQLQALWQQWQALVAQRRQEGTATSAESLLPQQQLLAVQTRLLQLSAAKRQAQATLAGALGVPLAQTQSMTLLDSEPDLRHFERDPDAAREQALLQRPELLSALGSYQMAELALQLEIAKQYPEMHLSPGYIWERGLVKLPLGLALTLPALDRNQAGIAQAVAARELAARELEWVQAKLITQFDLALSNLSSANQAQALSTTQLRLAQSQLSAAQAVFADGASDHLTLLSAQLQSVDAALAELAVRRELRRAQRALALALAAHKNDP
jgi:outer membrane protein TolC